MIEKYSDNRNIPRENDFKFFLLFYLNKNNFLFKVKQETLKHVYDNI